MGGTGMQSSRGVAEFFEDQGFTTVLAAHAGLLDAATRTVADGILYVGRRTRTRELFVYFRPYDRHVGRFQSVTGLPRTEVAFPGPLVDSAVVTGNLLNASCRLVNAAGVAAPFEVVGTRRDIAALAAAVNDPDRPRG